jgi:predicted dehydrogenase
MKNTLNYGMVGGDIKAFIGEVHRKALSLDPRVHLVAGSFSSNLALGKETAQTYGVSPDRSYDSYQEMAEKESQRPDGIDFVSICTPNFLHYAIAKEFLLHNINVVCEKPLCFTSKEADELEAIAKERHLVFGMTYSYTGYTMVKIAKEMIAKGDLGKIVTVKMEYLQDWLVDTLDPSKQEALKANVWRSNPKYSGIANTIGDIGTHSEEMLHYLLGRKVKRLLCCKDNFGMPLELNADILLEYEGGLRANLMCSQVTLGYANGFSFRVFGDKGSLIWHQEQPDVLIYTPLHEPSRTMKKGDSYLKKYEASSNSRLPAGHLEGFYTAFADVYRNIVSTILKKANGQEPSAKDLDFPTVSDGKEGVRFVEKAVLSSATESWVEF